MDAIERVKDALKDGDLLVYDPGTRPGKCNAAYVVVRQAGTYGGVESRKAGYTLAQVYAYVPLEKYGELNGHVARVKELLAPLYPQLRPTGHETPDLIEEDFQAHVRAIEYRILKKLEA